MNDMFAQQYCIDLLITIQLLGNREDYIYPSCDFYGTFMSILGAHTAYQINDSFLARSYLKILLGFLILYV